MGKKLGLYADNDDGIVEIVSFIQDTNARFEEPLKNKTKNKRGRRKSKRMKSN